MRDALKERLPIAGKLERDQVAWVAVPFHLLQVRGLHARLGHKVLGNRLNQRLRVFLRIAQADGRALFHDDLFRTLLNFDALFTPVGLHHGAADHHVSAVGIDDEAAHTGLAVQHHPDIVLKRQDQDPLAGLCAPLAHLIPVGKRHVVLLAAFRILQHMQAEGGVPL